jgi:hypothetical protein
MKVHGDDTLARLATLGAQLREVSPSLLRQRPGTSQRWFQGPQGCDLFLWSEDGKGLVQVQLTTGPRAAEWTPDNGVRTARILAFDPRRPEHDLSRMQFDRAPDAEALAQARAVLEAAPLDDVTLALVRLKLGLKR